MNLASSKIQILQLQNNFQKMTLFVHFWIGILFGADLIYRSCSMLITLFTIMTFCWELRIMILSPSSWIFVKWHLTSGCVWKSKEQKFQRIWVNVRNFTWKTNWKSRLEHPLFICFKCFISARWVNLPKVNFSCH